MLRERIYARKIGVTHCRLEKHAAGLVYVCEAGMPMHRERVRLA